MADEVESPLASLMRESYGVTRFDGTLRVTPNDTPYTLLRKTAKYIYKNQDWTAESIADSLNQVAKTRVSAYASEFNSHGDNTSPELKQDLLSNPENHLQGVAPVPLYGQQDGYTKYVANLDNGTSLTFNLDNENKSTRRQGQVYTKSTMIYGDPKEFFFDGNMDLTLGYGRLLKGIEQRYNDLPADTKQLLLKQDLNAYTTLLTKVGSRSTKYGKSLNYIANDIIRGKGAVALLTAGKSLLKKTANSYKYNIKYQVSRTSPEAKKFFAAHPEAAELLAQMAIDQTKNPDYKALMKDNYVVYGTKIYELENIASHYVFAKTTNDYLQDTFDMVQQVKYDAKVNGHSRATAWEEKKNINEATQQAMDTTKLNDHFKHVEIDNDVSIDLFHRFEGEMGRLATALPKSKVAKDQPTLRLRKLGNYKASGMYVPKFDTIIVDFRTMDQVGKTPAEARNSLTKGDPGINSFVHEYGHYLDYQLDGRKTPLSMDPKFAEIRSQYQQGLRQIIDQTGVKVDYSYLTTPTEIFARGFEKWVDHQGIKTNLAHNQEVLSSVRYEPFNGFEDKLYQYFDQVPGLKEFKEKYHGQDFSKENEPQRLAQNVSNDPKQLSLATQEAAKPKEPAPSKPKEEPKPSAPVQKAKQLVPYGDETSGDRVKVVNAAVTDKKSLDDYANLQLGFRTGTIDNLEKMVTDTAFSFHEVTPNRVIGAELRDQGATKQSIKLVSEDALQRNGFPIDKFADKLQKAQGYVPDKNGKFKPGYLYNYDDVQRAVNTSKDPNVANATVESRALQDACRQTHPLEYQAMNDQATIAITNKLKAIDASGKPNLHDKIAYSIAQAATYRGQASGRFEFHFNDAERAALRKLPLPAKENLYLKASREGRQIASSIQRQYKRQLEQGIKTPARVTKRWQGASQAVVKSKQRGSRTPKPKPAQPQFVAKSRGQAR